MKSSWDKSRVREAHYEIRNKVESLLRTKKITQAPLSEIAKELDMSPTAVSNAIRDARRVRIDRRWCNGMASFVQINPVFL